MFNIICLANINQIKLFVKATVVKITNKMYQVWLQWLIEKKIAFTNIMEENSKIVPIHTINCSFQLK